ncbi:MAG: translation elongation factor 4 [Bacteroidota bacterium]|nr:translation elongation factor 4 [Bacteroidota bacterium]
MKNIRNFSIIAHIDHGKSTLADRLLHITNTITDRELKEQILDDMDIERERGITIKSHAIQMEYEYKGENYILNLIDTPGHVDFSYEVSRSIKSCEGALLVVDASQGIEAQTISNLFLALEHDLTIIPVLNKIDLPGAQIEEVKDQIIDIIGCDEEDILLASAKTGDGIEYILEQVVEKIPSPSGNKEEPLQALIFDSVYNPYRGVIVYFRIFNGKLNTNDHVKFVNTAKEYQAEEIGILKLKQSPQNTIEAGNVGYLISGIKTANEIKVGDTITHVENPCDSAVKGFEDVKPMVFAGIYPIVNEEFEELRDCMEKLKLNDASLIYEPETSGALGYGFRCGFLGMLHMEIIQERLDREFDMNVITTVPNVSYKVNLTTKKQIKITNPSELPELSHIESIEEPFIKAQIISKSDFVGAIIKLCLKKRGILENQVYLTQYRVELTFSMPLSEIIFDFYDKLKTISRGYASLDYYPIGSKKSDLIKLDIMLNKDVVDALSCIIHREKAYEYGKTICQKLRKLIPRQQYEIAIQAAIGSKVISRETIKAVRKDVTAKCYGGDITRKRKLLEKQKKGKKRMKQVGNVEVPQSAFMAILSVND